MALAVFYWVIEVAHVDWWCAPFIWVGMNSITIYLCKGVVHFSGLASRVLGGNIKTYLNAQLPGAGDFLVAGGGLALALWLCHALYTRKVFLRI